MADFRSVRRGTGLEIEAEDESAAGNGGKAEKIATAMKDARTKLLENFDDEVQLKLRVRSQEAKNSLSRYGDWLGRLTSNRRLAMIASGMGSQLVALRFRRA